MSCGTGSRANHHGVVFYQSDFLVQFEQKLSQNVLFVPKETLKIFKNHKKKKEKKKESYTKSV